MANQESRLAIVIDTTRAEQSVKRLRELLRSISADGGKASAGLANSYRLVNTGLQSNEQHLQRASRAMAANSNSAVAARLNQDKLAISSSRVAAASAKAAAEATRNQIATANLAAASSRADAGLSRAAAAAARVAIANANAAVAATRAEIATSSLAIANSRAATAASRAAAAVSGEAAARERALAAASKAAAAAANAAAAQDRAAAASVRLAAAEARAATEANSLTGGLGRANTQARSLTGTLNNLQGLLLGGMFGMATLGIIKTADKMQNLDSQVKLVTNSMEQFKAVQGELRDIANRQYSDIESITQLYTRSQRALSSLGKSQNDVLQFTENLSMAMLVGGASAQEQSAALLQLSQALGSGRLAGDEFRSVAEQAPILLSLISKEMGVTQGELKKLAADGKITSEIIYNALSGATEELTAQVALMPITVGQAFTVLKNNYKTFIGDFINNTTGLSGIIGGAIGVIAQNFDTLATVLMAGAAVWGIYALAGSTFVTTTIPALVLGIQTTIFSILSQSAAMQTAIASTFSLAAMQDFLTAATYRLQQARVVASLTLLNYKLLLLESIAVMQAKIASVAGAIAVQAQYALALATSGNLLAIFSLSVKGAVSNLVAKVSTTAAAARANAIYAASLVSTNGIVGATSLGIRALTGMIIAKTGAMIAAVRQTSAYSLALGGLGLAARATTGILTTLTAAVGRLGAVILAHPIMALAAVIFSVTASTRGWKKAMEDVTDAIKILGFIFLDVVRNIVNGVKWVWSATSDWFKNTIGGGGAVTTFLSSVFGKWFEGTRGGFVGLLQVVARVFDSIAKAGLAACITLDKGFRNLGIAIENIAKGIANGFIDAFNWVSRGFTNMINFVKRQANSLISAMNEIPFVDIGVRFDDSKAAAQLDHFAGSSYITNSVSGNYQQASNIVGQYGAEAFVNRGIKALDEHKAATAAASQAALDAVPNFEAMGDAVDGAGKKAKKGAKNLKEAKEKMSEAEKAAKALNDAFLKAQQGLQRTFNLIGHDTNLAQWVYDLSDPMHDLFNLAEDSKDVLKGFAASIDISELSYDLGKSNKDLEHQIKLLDAKSDLERELMDIEKETADLLEKYEVFKNIPGFAHVYKEIEAEAKLNEQWKKNLATKEATVAINKELTQSTGDLNKQMALLGNDSPLNSFLYDLQNTEKYANAGAEALERYEQALRSLEKAELAQKMREDMGGLRTELLGYKSNTTDRDKNDYELEDTLTRIRQARELGLNIGGQYDQLEQIAKQRHADKMAEIENAMYQNRAGLFASASKALLGENSRMYRLLFAIEKGYALQSAWLKSKKAVLDAYAETPGSVWNKALAAAKAAADTGLMAAAIAAVQAPIGQAHDGIMSVPKSGTWNLEKGERVLPAHTAKAMDKKLEQGGKVIIHNYSGEKAEAKQDMDGNTIVVIGKMVNGLVDQKLAKFKRQEQRQGGLFSGA